VRLRSDCLEIAAKYRTQAQNSLNDTPVDDVGVVKYPIIKSIAGMFSAYVLNPSWNLVGNDGCIPVPGHVLLSMLTLRFRCTSVPFLDYCFYSFVIHAVLSAFHEPAQEKSMHEVCGKAIQ
jgi:hypothetical protein